MEGDLRGVATDMQDMASATAGIWDASGLGTLASWSFDTGKNVVSGVAEYVPFLIPGDPEPPETRDNPVWTQFNPFGDAADYRAVMCLIKAVAHEQALAKAQIQGQTELLASAVAKRNRGWTMRYLNSMIAGNDVPDESDPLIASCNRMVSEEWTDILVCDFWTMQSELSEGADHHLLRRLLQDACNGLPLPSKGYL